jgi:hypothetical protein
MDTSTTHMHDHSLSRLSTDTSITSGRAILVVRAQTSLLSEMMQSCKCFQYLSKMPTFTYDRVNSVIIKNAINWTLYIIYLIFVILKGHNPVLPAAQETQENGHNPVVPAAQKTKENGAPKTCDHKAKHTFRQTALSMRFSVYFHCIRICWIFYSYNLYVKKNIHGYKRKES